MVQHPRAHVVTYSTASPSSHSFCHLTSLPHPCPPHHLLKLSPPYTLPNPGTIIRLEYHILQQILGDVLLQRHGDPLQVSQRQGLNPLGAREQPERLVHLGQVRLPRRVVIALVELQRADGDERLPRGMALVVGIEDLEKLLEFGFRWRNVESPSGVLFTLVLVQETEGIRVQSLVVHSLHSSTDRTCSWDRQEEEELDGGRKRTP